jgi:hypothetical protein
MLPPGENLGGIWDLLSNKTGIFAERYLSRKAWLASMPLLTGVKLAFKILLGCALPGLSLMYWLIFLNIKPQLDTTLLLFHLNI